MNGTTEGLQPVADFLPQKPLTESDDPLKATPVTEPEKALPGFPSEPRLDAPVTTSSQVEPDESVGVSQPISDVNAESYQQNATLTASISNAVEPISVLDAAPTNGVSPVKSGEVESSSDQPGNQSLELPKHGETTSSLSPIPPTESLPPQELSSLSQPLATSSIDQSISAASIPTQLSPPIEQHPTSDLREVPEPIPQDSPTTLRIKADKLQEDLARDPELAEGLAADSEAPIERTLAPPPVPEEPPSRPDSGLGMSDSAPVGDAMDTSLDQPPPPTAPVESAAPLATSPLPPQEPEPTIPVEEPAAPAPTPALPPNDALPAADQTMTDAPTISSEPTAFPELKHEREEDHADEAPASKRPRTETDSIEPAFKVPELPQTIQTTDQIGGPPTDTSADVGDAAVRITPARIKHLNKGIQSAKKVQCSRFFRTPVDPVAMNIPNYPEIVKEPMDLSTVEKKLKGGEYLDVVAFKADVDLMINNAIKFNGPDHLVVKEGRELQQRMVDAISSMPPAEFEEPSRAEKKAQKVKIEPSRAVPARRQSSSNAGAARSPASATTNQTFALTPDGVPLIRRDSNVADGRPKRAIHPPKRRDDIAGGRPKKKKFEWQLKFCREVLNELKKPKHYNYAQFFYFPVDPVALNIPSYHSVIKKPMDLQTVENKLNGNEYEKAKDFEDDVRQIFKNCFKFNVKGDHVFNCGEQFEKVFNEKWATKDDWLDDHEPTSGPVSPGSESEEQEEEDEDSGDSEAERNEKLQQLQKQIEMMSKQMGELAQAKKKKKPTPPVPGKKAKKSGSKKEKSGATFPALSGNKKDKSKSKSKTEKERFVTYNEKQYISMGISSLPDDRMSEALRIIQSNVPSLKNTHETEIELDIDELPNGVLLKLLQFVKKHVPQAAPEPESITYVNSSSGGPSSKPKKNKPMSKHEQEAQIEELKGRLGKYGDQISPEPVQSIEKADSSGDESDSEESEEE